MKIQPNLIAECQIGEEAVESKNTVLVIITLTDILQEKSHVLTVNNIPKEIVDKDSMVQLSAIFPLMLLQQKIQKTFNSLTQKEMFF